MGVIGSPEDRYLIEKTATDISVVTLNAYNSKGLQIEADITFYCFYGLTYMMFKHGSQLHRRLIVAGRFYVRRSVFFVMLLLGFYFYCGWS